MAENTKIEWADHTFNPWIGCTKISPACDHCYAEAWAKRYRRAAWGTGNPRQRTCEHNWRLPLKWNAEAERMAQTALLMQYYGGLGEIAQHGCQMEGAARIAHGWADGIEGESM